MDYLKLFECGYTKTRENLGHIIENRLEYLGEMFFNFTTYDGDMAALFAAKALEVCKAITFGTTFEYIRASEEKSSMVLNYVQYAIFPEQAELGRLYRGAWWEYEITFGSLGLWDGDEQISQELFFQKPDWEKFMLALFEFASIEEKENDK